MSHHRKPEERPPAPAPIRGPWLHNGRLLVVALAAVTLGCTGAAQAPPVAPVAAQTVGVAAPALTPQYAPVPLGDQQLADPPRYDRKAFGPAWADVDRNGCDTRNDILARDLDPDTRKPGTHDCVVQTGVLVDPYTDVMIKFERGQGTSEKVQIDHVVPLSWAWEHGAWRWDDKLRREFANDPMNLRATDGRVNASKGDSGPSEWMPPNQSAWIHCAYVIDWSVVLEHYGLVPGQSDAQVLVETERECNEGAFE